MRRTRAGSFLAALIFVLVGLIALEAASFLLRFASEEVTSRSRSALEGSRRDM